MENDSIRKISRAKRLVFGILLVATVAAGFIGGALWNKNSKKLLNKEEGKAQQAALIGDEAGKSLIQSVAGAVSKTFADLFGPAEESEPVLEIDLGAPAGALPFNDAKESPEAVSDVAAMQRQEKLAKPAPKSPQKPDPPTSSLETCEFSRGEAAPTRSVVLNEIAWMGSLPAQGQSASNASRAEWFELKNLSDKSVSLEGWQLVSEDEGLRVRIGRKANVGPASFYFLARGGEYEGVLSNGGEWLKLFDEECRLVDEVNASSGWPAGDNARKYTMERDTHTFEWYTSAAEGGTPRAQNSARLAPYAADEDSTTAQSHTATRYRVRVEKKGNGGGIVVAHRGELSCGTKCSDEYARGTEVFLTPVPSSDSSFSSWSGACSGSDVCRLIVERSASVTATFTLLPKSPYMYVPPPSEASAPPPASTSSTTPPSASGSISHLVIREVQITGGTGKTDNDFIKIYNPTHSAVDAGGWKLRKRTQSGSESSVKVFPDGSTVAADSYFIWANSQSGFSQSLSANASSTQTLSANNSIVLLDAEGNVIDAVAWGQDHAAPYVEGQPYPENPGASQVLTRKLEGTMVMDTDNNAQDFELH